MTQATVLDFIPKSEFDYSTPAVVRVSFMHNCQITTEEFIKSGGIAPALVVAILNPSLYSLQRNSLGPIVCNPITPCPDPSPDPRTLPLKNYKNIGFLSNTGPDILKNHKATKPIPLVLFWIPSPLIKR